MREIDLQKILPVVNFRRDVFGHWDPLQRTRLLAVVPNLAKAITRDVIDVGS